MQEKTELRKIRAKLAKLFKNVEKSAKFQEIEVKTVKLSKN